MLSSGVNTGESLLQEIHRWELLAWCWPGAGLLALTDATRTSKNYAQPNPVFARAVASTDGHFVNSEIISPCLPSGWAGGRVGTVLCLYNCGLARCPGISSCQYVIITAVAPPRLTCQLSSHPACQASKGVSDIRHNLLPREMQCTRIPVAPPARLTR